MIDADHITFNDDGTAWWLPIDNEFGTDVLIDSLRDDEESGESFPIEVECEHQNARTISGVPGDGDDWQCDECGSDDGSPSYGLIHRVSVIPGMVLPIHALVSSRHTSSYIAQTGFTRSDRWFLIDRNADNAELINLPPAARSGMFAVKLKVSA